MRGPGAPRPAQASLSEQEAAAARRRQGAGRPRQGTAARGETLNRAQGPADGQRGEARQGPGLRPRTLPCPSPGAGGAARPPLFTSSLTKSREEAGTAAHELETTLPGASTALVLL